MNVWAWIGWLGNIAFFSRFFVQWLASERAGHSVAPRSFWWLSLTGSLSLGEYTFVKGEPVLLAGHVLNWPALRPQPDAQLPPPHEPAVRTPAPRPGRHPHQPVGFP
ncbi:MAG: lipid-A-disaccharide synthase N-terminal domain-containing protein [Planctomycetota bacterium]